MRVTADAAYDTVAVYETAGARGTTVVVPPARTANVMVGEDGQEDKASAIRPQPVTRPSRRMSHEQPSGGHDRTAGT